MANKKWNKYVEYHTLGIGLDDVLSLYQGKMVEVPFKSYDGEDMLLSIFCGMPMNSSLSRPVFEPVRVGEPTLRERIRFLFKREF